MWKEIIETLKKLYINIKCTMCCKSTCSVQLGDKEKNVEEEEEEQRGDLNVRETSL
tara:strand:+ start:2741 stop:2908 length:168 start_codon:yes stop_codon:yes gene_type:complete